jgi:hypothetical protein
LLPTRSTGNMFEPFARNDKKYASFPKGDFAK